MVDDEEADNQCRSVGAATDRTNSVSHDTTQPGKAPKSTSDATEGTDTEDNKGGHKTGAINPEP